MAVSTGVITSSVCPKVIDRYKHTTYLLLAHQRDLYQSYILISSKFTLLKGSNYKVMCVFTFCGHCKISVTITHSATCATYRDLAPQLSGIKYFVITLSQWFSAGAVSYARCWYFAGEEIGQFEKNQLWLITCNKHVHKKFALRSSCIALNMQTQNGDESKHVRFCNSWQRAHPCIPAGLTLDRLPLLVSSAKIWFQCLVKRTAYHSLPWISISY